MRNVLTMKMLQVALSPALPRAPENPDEMFDDLLALVQSRFVNQILNDRTQRDLRATIESYLDQARKTYGIDRGKLISVALEVRDERAIVLTPKLANIAWSRIDFEEKSYPYPGGGGKTLLVAKFGDDRGWGRSQLEAAVDLFERRADRLDG